MPFMEQFIIPLIVIPLPLLLTFPMKVQYIAQSSSSIFTEKVTQLLEYVASPLKPYTSTVPVPPSLRYSVTGRLPGASMSFSMCCSTALLL